MSLSRCTATLLVIGLTILCSCAQNTQRPRVDTVPKVTMEELAAEAERAPTSEATYATRRRQLQQWISGAEKGVAKNNPKRLEIFRQKLTRMEKNREKGNSRRAYRMLDECLSELGTEPLRPERIPTAADHSNEIPGVAGCPFGMSADGMVRSFSFDDVRALGMRWARSGTSEEYLDMCRRAGLQQMVVVGGQTLPRDMPAYRDTIAKFVRKYGPGTAHAVSCIEVCNEPNLDTFWKGTREEYAELLRETYRAAKQGNPAVKVALGSVAFSDRESVSFFDTVLGHRFRDGTRGRDYVELVDLHLYGTPRALTAYVQQFRKLMAGHGLDVPIWCTEYGMNSRDRETGEDHEQRQAAYVVKATVTALGIGVERMFWFGLADRFAMDDVGFGDMGLIAKGGRKKPAYYAYRLMTDTLANVRWTEAERVDTGRRGPACWRLPTGGRSSPIHAVWGRENSAGPVRVSVGPGLSRVRVVPAVPADPSRPYPDMFGGSVVPVRSGVVSFPLSAGPVFILPLEP